MLPVDYLKPCIAMMETLMEDYRSSMVLCTATQPALDKIFIGERTFVELCPNVKEQFEFFRRVTYQNLGYVPIDQLAPTAERKTGIVYRKYKKMCTGTLSQIKGRGSLSSVNKYVSKTPKADSGTDQGKIKAEEKVYLNFY